MDLEENNDSIIEDHPKASSICAIDKKSVHRICSGQVVLTLGTAVTELVENSIDANATIVDVLYLNHLFHVCWKDVKLKEYGSEQIEVSDNGIGVHPSNFEGLTLKHHTSKLRDFGDLMNVETFGFRGEALSSLCALCDMTVTTRHKGEAVGTKLEFDHNGKITKQEAQARQVGTKVVLQNLFYTLPVRHKEFQRNLKKEFVKMVQVLNSYCIISTGIRITCTNVTSKGSRSTVVSSQGNSLLQENISNVFGPKQLQSLLEFRQRLPGEDVCTEYGLKSSVPSLFKIEGYVSKCEHGQGRSSTDRQFLFVNGRPFDSTKLTKVINEVYHQYNRHQYPFVVLKIGVNKEGVDVNVTPDKRQVFMEGEKILLATVKASLVAMFESTTSVLQIQQPDISTRLVKSKSESDSSNCYARLTTEPSLTKTNMASTLSKLKRSYSSAFAKEDSVFSSQQSPSKSTPLSKQRKMDCFMQKSLPTEMDDNDGKFVGHSVKLHDKSDIFLADSGSDLPNSVNCVFNTDLKEFNHQDKAKQDSDYRHDYKQELHKEEIITIDKSGDHNFELKDQTDTLNAHTALEADIKDDLGSFEGEHVNVQQEFKVTEHPLAGEEDSESVIFNHKDVTTSRNVKEVALSPQKDMKEKVGARCEIVDGNSNLESSAIKIFYHGDGEAKKWDKMNNYKDISFEIDANKISVSAEKDHTGSQIIEKVERQDHQLDKEEDVEKKETKIAFSMELFKQNWKNRRKQSSTDKFSRAFRAKINPADNQAAEQELQREIKKESFSQMEVLGQFNMGFIITKLEDDLFIVDQHATDEKYNFETLQRETVIKSQKLIHPLNLELTASNETILVDNLDIFKKNGFEFLIDEEGPPTQRVKLVSTPVSKNWNFGKEDIEEMIFMLTDSPGVMCRPSRVRAMFASRSCRKSIMIGTVLNKAEMRKLLCHMGEIEQPWNCPHGRPTMRHLINLDMIPK